MIREVIAGRSVGRASWMVGLFDDIVMQLSLFFFPLGELDGKVVFEKD